MAVCIQEAAQARPKSRQRAAVRRLHLTGEQRARTQLSAAFHFSEVAPELLLSMAQMRTLRAPSMRVHAAGISRRR